VTSISSGPIGVFDSGYGGLTVFKEIAALLPAYDFISLGDNARTPYGTRSFEINRLCARGGRYKFFTTDRPEDFDELAVLFYGGAVASEKAVL